MQSSHSVQQAMSAYVAAVKNGTFPDNTQHAWA
jgi:3-methyl-2-oxobutanoate hydroxymethyltransferase